MAKPLPQPLSSAAMVAADRDWEGAGEGSRVPLASCRHRLPLTLGGPGRQDASGTGETGGADVESLLSRGLRELGAYSLLEELTSGGHRLSGSAGAANAVAWGERRMKELGFANVRLVPCKVTHWVRGREEASMEGALLSICALGGSVGTPRGGIEAEVIEVRSLEQCEKLGDRAKGKIIFFNRPMDASLPNTFAAYGGAVDQRVQGASVAAKVGAVAVLVRSMTLDKDDAPHTGALRYADGVPQIPAAALGWQSADRLALRIARRGTAKVKLELGCRTYPDAPSASVVGELVGTEKPNEVIVVGGHLDSWDLSHGAHDDGSGCVQAMEALRLLRVCGLRPKRTIRAVLFMNEENGLRGALSYAVENRPERHIAGIESDSGGFAPRAFGVGGTKEQVEKVRAWLPGLSLAGIERIDEGGGGADVGPLKEKGAVTIGLEPESQRYFDYHHSRKDTIDKVNPRELELGAIAMAILAWRISELGV
ncbi:MAG: M28 family peptidase [Fimbriimonadaceae bacterium]|nr:M28 family peptidase [Fimbriimonadaceae bacterium]